MSLAALSSLDTRSIRVHRKAVSQDRLDPDEQQRIKEEADRLSASFEEFVKAAWPLIEPGAPLIWEWHMEVLCRVLQWAALFRRVDIIIEIVINLPPGSSKSNIICILYQPWVWTFWPESRWITATHEANLALKQSRKSRDLVTSDWYQARWPLKLTVGAKQQKSWENVKGGTREALGRNGTATGHHAHFIVPDDVLKEQEVRLGAPAVVARRMEEAEGFVFGTLGSRAVGKGATRILTGQRLHAKDPAARAIREGWYHVRFPVHYNPDKADPLDRRTERDEMLCPDLRGELYWDKDAIRLGPTATRAQHEQDPSDEAGSLISMAYFAERWKELPPQLKETMRTQRVGPGQTWITSWDLRFDKGVTKSEVCGQVWCGFKAHFYLVDQVKGYWGFKDSKQAIKDLARANPWINTHLLEKAANAAACEDDLSNEIHGLKLEPVAGGTFARTQACEGVWSSGAVITPADAPWMGGSKGFVDEHVGYDGTTNADQVSSSSLALLHLGVKGNKGQRFRENMAKIRQSPTFRRLMGVG
jgi:phage terminase large subunit-like protein